MRDHVIKKVIVILRGKVERETRKQELDELLIIEFCPPFPPPCSRVTSS